MDQKVADVNGTRHAGVGDRSWQRRGHGGERGSRRSWPTVKDAALGIARSTSTADMGTDVLTALPIGLSGSATLIGALRKQSAGPTLA